MRGTDYLYRIIDKTKKMKGTDVPVCLAVGGIYELEKGDITALCAFNFNMKDIYYKYFGTLYLGQAKLWFYICINNIFNRIEHNFLCHGYFPVLFRVYPH